MKIKKRFWHKASRTVENPAQAGDAALAFHFQSRCDVLEINTQDHFPFLSLPSEGAQLEIWGVARAFKKIPISTDYTFSTSLKVVGVGEKSIEMYTHFVLHEVVDGKKKTTTYHMQDADRIEIVTGYF